MEPNSNVPSSAVCQPSFESSPPTRRFNGWSWLLLGVLVGIGIATLWPQRQLTAATSDRNEKFGMCTVYVSENLEAVFVLDFLTGQLTGACLGLQGDRFVQSFVANVGADLNVPPGAKAQYAMATGLAQIRATGQNQPAASVIYVAELNSGKVGCYGIPFRLPNAKNPVPIKLVSIDFYQFREAIAAE